MDISFCNRSCITEINYTFELWECVLLKIVNRIQKLRKKIGLEPTDQVEIFFETLESADGTDPSALQRVFKSQVLNAKRL